MTNHSRSFALIRGSMFLLLTATCLAQAPSYKALKYPPLRDIKIPNVATFTLNDGIRVYLVEDHELPTIHGFALIRTGNLFDPKDKVGLANLTGDVMRSGGTPLKTGDQIDEQLENIAASVESRIDESSGEVSFSTLTNTTRPAASRAGSQMHGVQLTCALPGHSW